MTRRIEIVNSSNWDGEDYLVEYELHNGHIVSVILQPTDIASIVNPPAVPEKFVSVKITCLEPAEPIKPFKDENGKQVFPKTTCELK